MKTTFTKKMISEYIAECIDEKTETIENVWNEMKKMNLAGNYCSQEKIKNFWNYFSFVISDSIFENWNMNWEYFHN